jgi:hypothetical protein
MQLSVKWHCCTVQQSSQLQPLGIPAECEVSNLSSLIPLLD